RPLDVYLDEKFYRPMGLQYMAYAPLRRFSKENIAPTVKYDFLQRGTLQGYVHDEAASVLGGIAGNAGLFASAQDVALVYQMLLNKGLLGDKRYLSRTTCTLFMTFKSKSSRRGLGFDKPDARNPENSPCATDAPASVFGHTGFTGTCAWADPDNGLVYVFLSNRIYPMVYGRTALGKLNIRSRIQEVIYKSLMK
ncbi:serine hydrolase, partial [Bacteroides heparinolyticus]|uniref:serine hydrolase n=1 Tax=Prevotella heparinolytica TaxID=28113 RepID=UPI00359F9F73